MTSPKKTTKTNNKKKLKTKKSNSFGINLVFFILDLIFRAVIVFAVYTLFFYLFEHAFIELLGFDFRNQNWYGFLKYTMLFFVIIGTLATYSNNKN